MGGPALPRLCIVLLILVLWWSFRTMWHYKLLSTNADEENISHEDHDSWIPEAWTGSRELCSDLWQQNAVF
jgi:hypothetical protein